MSTIGKIPIDCFASEPSPEELGALIARWNSEDQANFFMCLAEELHNCCGGKAQNQLSSIARSLAKIEDELCDGKGSALISDLFGHIHESRSCEAKS